MGLRIQNNIAAMNAHRQLTISDAGLSKSLERLSSGYRINRAADDAAGLSISQAFRADIASYKVASRNTTEASALLQVAEGAMDQIGNMLTRLKELATQAASANSAANLDKINAEASELKLEIERIATSTEYAGAKLINGTFGVEVDAASDIDATDGLSGATGLKSGETYAVATVQNADGVTWDITITDADDNSQTVTEVAGPGAGTTSSVSFGAFGITLKINENITAAMTGDVVATAGGNATFQVGAQNAADNQLTISLGDATLDGLTLGALSLGTADDARAALDLVDAAIADLNTVRGDIGAYMNRLSYAAANLASTVENVQAAESVIRDVDMAAEMTTFTKNQILLQAGTAMLAQANMAPQQVLSLFG
ncbi:MAG: flagellin [Desulfobacterales bacterium]|nr:flagellin [Desulfobacterales bacterium]